MSKIVVKSKVHRLLSQAPFRPFALNLENGDRVMVEHPENIAFDPVDNGSAGSKDFYVISGQLRVFGTFDAVRSVTLVDRGD